MKKRKNTAKKEKSLAKSAREAFRFQMKWEAKKMYPGNDDQLARRIDMECTVIEEAQLLPTFQQGKAFIEAFKGKFGTNVAMESSVFLRNSIVAQCFGLSPNVPSETFALPTLKQAMYAAPLSVTIQVNLSNVRVVFQWVQESNQTIHLYPEGFEVQIGALSVKFPLVEQLHALALEKAQALQREVNANMSGNIRQEILAYLSQATLKHLPLLEDFDAMGNFMAALHALPVSRPVVLSYSTLLKQCLLAYCFGITDVPLNDEAGNLKNMDMEITAQPIDCDTIVHLMKIHFGNAAQGTSNGLEVNLKLFKVRLPLLEAFKINVMSGAESLYNHIDGPLKQRIEAELDWYEHWGVMGDMLLLRDFIIQVDAKFDAPVASDPTLLGHSVAAFCLGLAKDCPDVEDEKDLLFFQGKNRSVSTANVHFDSNKYSDIAAFAQTYFGAGIIEEKKACFSLGKMRLYIYKDAPVFPEGIKWYLVETIRKMMEKNAKYEY